MIRCSALDVKDGYKSSAGKYQENVSSVIFVKMINIYIYSIISLNDAKGGSAIIMEDFIKSLQSHPIQNKEVQFITTQCT